jgi:hypothetical protein
MILVTSQIKLSCIIDGKENISSTSMQRDAEIEYMENVLKERVIERPECLRNFIFGLRIHSKI